MVCAMITFLLINKCLINSLRVVIFSIHFHVTCLVTNRLNVLLNYMLLFHIILFHHDTIR